MSTREEEADSTSRRQSMWVQRKKESKSKMVEDFKGKFERLRRARKK